MLGDLWQGHCRRDVALQPSLALTQLAEAAPEAQAAGTVVGLAISGAAASIPAGILGAVLPLSCKTRSTIRALGGTAQPCQAPGIARVLPGRAGGQGCLPWLQGGQAGAEHVACGARAGFLLLWVSPGTYSCSLPHAAAVPDCPSWTPLCSPASLEPLALDNERIKCHPPGQSQTQRQPLQGDPACLQLWGTGQA